MSTEGLDALQSDIPAIPETSELAKLAALAEVLCTHEIIMLAKEEQYKQAKENYRQISEHDIPELMAEIGMVKFTLESGATVSVKEDFSISLSGDKLDVAMNWLKSIGEDDLIKNEVKVNFGAKEGEEANDFYRNTIEKGLHAEKKETINTGTFKSLIKERLGDGEEVPLEELSAYQYKKTIIVK